MHRWKLSALAAAAFVSVALTPTDASALALGSLRVQSALGQNLRAEIAVPQITEQELASLDVQIASPEMFRSQGMDYSLAVRNVQVQVQRNADGTATLLLRSDTPINDPFVDLVIQSNWHAGNLLRTYTLLLDPPATAAPTPVVAAQVPATTPAPASVAGRSYASSGATTRPSAPPAVTPTPPSAPPADTTATSELRVRAGDTAGRIANANRASGVSLDQMLVAMLRQNPNAFINGNVNRIRAGAVVQMPTRDEALATSVGEARQIVAAQSRDFNSFRRNLATKAPQAEVQAADRSLSGQVQARVEDSRPAAATPDKLTLSKGAVANSAAEAQLAAEQQAADQDSRLSELQRNLAELNQLAQNSTAPAIAPAVPATSETSVPSEPLETAKTDAGSLPALEVATDNAAVLEPAPTTETPAAVATDAAAVEASAEPTPAPTPATTPAAPLPTPAAPTPSIADELPANPLIPAGGAIVALLLGLLGYRSWKRRRDAQALQDPLLGDSQIGPDSFFGSSGGQQIDTSAAATEGAATTMAYSPSQLDGGADVDPVAEADVYLAYGRDVQAEEILKEALRTQPDRLSVHLKLAEIYVKRSDIQSLENTARGLQAVSQPSDAEWSRVVNMGRELDPGNAFFANAVVGGTLANSALPSTSAFAEALNESRQSNDPAQESSSIRLDLPGEAPAPYATAAPAPSEADYAALDSHLGSQFDLTTPPASAEPPTLVQDSVMDKQNGDDLQKFDLDLSGFSSNPDFATPTPAETSSGPSSAISLDFDLDSPALGAADTPAETVNPNAPVFDAPVFAPSPTPTASMPAMDFDLGSLDLDLGTTPSPASEAQPVHNQADDPLSTKLDLAQEFNSIGDSEGARALIEEVLADASGPLQARAQKMLSELD